MARGLEHSRDSIAQTGNSLRRTALAGLLIVTGAISLLVDGCGGRTNTVSNYRAKATALSYANAITEKIEPLPTARTTGRGTAVEKVRVSVPAARGGGAYNFVINRLIARPDRPDLAELTSVSASGLAGQGNNRRTVSDYMIYDNPAGAALSDPAAEDWAVNLIVVDGLPDGRLYTTAKSASPAPLNASQLAAFDHGFKRLIIGAETGAPVQAPAGSG